MNTGELNQEYAMRSYTLFLYLLGYVLLISPPRSIDLTFNERARRGELSKQPLFIVMMIEFLIRSALLLILAVSIESLMTKMVYETYKLDVVFSAMVLLGAFHALSYYLLLGLLRASIGLDLSIRLYRLFRNLCYAAIPGLFTVMPLLVWKWKQQQIPFEDGLVFFVYLITTLVMAVLGIIEAMLMNRKPLGLDNHL